MWKNANKFLPAIKKCDSGYASEYVLVKTKDRVELEAHGVIKFSC